MGEFPSTCMCGQARNAAIAQEAMSEVEPAILALPAENPERRRAVARAERRVSSRYQCRLQQP